MKPCLYYPLYPGGRRKAFTISYDDGNDCDARLVEMLRAHHAKGTFNINSGMFGALDDAPEPRRWRRMTESECVQLYGSDMEVAIHGAIHPFWDKMSAVSLMRDILDDRRELERLFGREIRGSAAPYGRLPEEAKEILRLAGFAYCRAGAATKKLKLCGFDPLRFHATVRHRDPDAVALAREFADAPARGGQPLLYYLFGHSYEFVEQDNWALLEELLAILCDREDTWYCTNIELFDYLADARRLCFTVDLSAVTNPSAQDIWLRRTVKLHAEEAIEIRIPAGETVRLPTP